MSETIWSNTLVNVSLDSFSTRLVGASLSTTCHIVVRVLIRFVPDVVQSYGSRYVMPPVIVSDVSRPEAMTIKWSTYAQSLTKSPMKGMLTGPVTILNWSYNRCDISREVQCRQLALALRDEVNDLEKAGIFAIQVDEPALQGSFSFSFSFAFFVRVVSPFLLTVE